MVLIMAFLVSVRAMAAGVVDTIIVDQFGYRPEAVKIAVFAAPQKGFNAPLSSGFRPGDTFEVRKSADGVVVFTGSVTSWNGSAVHEQSGDMAWHGDFSALRAPGRYYVSVPGGTAPGSRSFDFTIAENVYAVPLLHSVRSYYYQRCGCDITNKRGGSWNHKACHVGPGQDLKAQVWTGKPGGKPKDVHGGWHDAGDYRKYVPFTYSALWDLLHAVEWYPGSFTDATNIPESGNRVPDALDEIKYELDWILRMQMKDGGVASVVGVSGGDGGSPPEKDKAPRYYGEEGSPATSTAAMVFAQGARLFKPYGKAYPGYSTKLRKAALAAWGWLEKHPENVKYINQGMDQANANVSDTDDADRRLGAAAELFHATGENRFREYFDRNYAKPRTGGERHHPIGKGYFETGVSMNIQMAMVSYALAPGATASTATAIVESLRKGADRIVEQRDSDPYLAHMWDGHYCWGSNSMKSRWGDILLWAARLEVAPASTSVYTAQAEEYLHYIHGRNPLNLVYLTNMGERGAKAGVGRSAMAFFHGWFSHDVALYDGESSKLGPAPGFLTGGPNMFYKPDGQYAPKEKIPPQGQPPMKSYLDWSAGWPEDSWEVTENGIYYQAAYTFLAAAFASGSPSTEK